MPAPRQYDPVRLMWRRVLLVVLGAAFFASMGAAWGIYGKLQESALMRHEAETHLADLKSRYDALDASIRSLDSSRGQEEVMRDTYDVGRPGEGLIVIVDEKASSSAAGSGASSRPWWRFW